jgi:hypothetical protein
MMRVPPPDFFGRRLQRQVLLRRGTRTDGVLLGSPGGAAGQKPAYHCDDLDGDQDIVGAMKLWRHLAQLTLIAARKRPRSVRVGFSRASSCFSVGEIVTPRAAVCRCSCAETGVNCSAPYAFVRPIGTTFARGADRSSSAGRITASENSVM